LPSTVSKREILYGKFPGLALASDVVDCDTFDCRDELVNHDLAFFVVFLDDSHNLHALNLISDRPDPDGPAEQVIEGLTTQTAVNPGLKFIACLLSSFHRALWLFGGRLSFWRLLFRRLFRGRGTFLGDRL
jgi:hypothetical protein